MFGQTRVEVRPKPLVPPQQIMAQQIVLRSELPVQAHLVDARALYDRVNADVARALEIKEIFRGIQDLRVRNGARDVAASSPIMSDSHGQSALNKIVDTVTERSLLCEPL